MLVALIIEIVNALVAITAGLIQLGVTENADPVNRFFWSRDTSFPASITGLNRTLAEKAELDSWNVQAKANIANPENWWNQAAGHAKDPLWMAGQKRIVDNYTQWDKDVRWRRGPGIDNLNGIIAASSVAKQSNIDAYRRNARAEFIKVLMFSLLDQAIGDEELTFEDDTFLSGSVLRLLYPGDEDTAQGRIPRFERGEMLSHYLSLIYAGLIDPASPVPWWILGMNQSEYLAAVQKGTPWPNALQLIQQHRRKQDGIAQAIMARYA